MLRQMHNSILNLILLSVLLGAYVPSASSTPDIRLAYTQTYETAFAALQPTATPRSIETPIPLPTAIRTAPALPNTFIADRLNSFGTPHTDFQDTCQDEFNSTMENGRFKQKFFAGCGNQTVRCR